MLRCALLELDYSNHNMKNIFECQLNWVSIMFLLGSIIHTDLSEVANFCKRKLHERTRTFCNTNKTDWVNIFYKVNEKCCCWLFLIFKINTFGLCFLLQKMVGVKMIKKELICIQHHTNFVILCSIITQEKYNFKNTNKLSPKQKQVNLTQSCPSTNEDWQ